jgi:uroporphyrinogen decarboxylase
MMHGDATFSIPDGDHMRSSPTAWPTSPEKLKRKPPPWWTGARRAERSKAHGGLDGFALCSDYCFNTGPVPQPGQFGEFVTPYLAPADQGYRDMGFYVIKHTDGNIMPILDQLVQTNPHALHSLDPQAGVDIAEVKRLYGDQVCLIGNVNCGLLDTGTDEKSSSRPATRCTRHARRRLHLLHQQLHLHRHAPGALRADAGCLVRLLPLRAAISLAFFSS